MLPETREILKRAGEVPELTEILTFSPREPRKMNLEFIDEESDEVDLEIDEDSYKITMYGADGNPAKENMEFIKSDITRTSSLSLSSGDALYPMEEDVADDVNLFKLTGDVWHRV